MTDAPPAPPPLSWWRREGSTLLEFVGLTGIAVAQPTLDILGKNAGLFVLWRTRSAQLIALVTMIVLGPPIALWLIELAATRVRRRARQPIHIALVVVCATVVGVEVAKQTTSLGRVPVAIIGTLGGIAVGAIAARFHVVRAWFRLMAAFPVALAVLFAGFSPASDLVFNADVPIATVAVGAPARVVMIVLDELPTTSLLDGRGRIDASLFPNLAAFADDSTWYRNHTTVSPFTETAIPAILSGTLPRSEHAVAFAGEYPHNLFTLLGGTYEMHVRESVTQLCPASACRSVRSNANVRPGFRGMVRDVATLWRDFAAPSRAPEFSYDGLGALEADALSPALRFTATLKPTTNPRIDFLHTLLPHFPWHYNGAFQDYTSFPQHTNGLADNGWATDHIGALSRVRHLLQVQAVDTIVGQVMDRLRAIDAYDDSLVVLTADHGVAFQGGRPIRGVSSTTWPDILWTPLLIKAPGQRTATVDDRRALSIDVLPTIGELLDVGMPWNLDGASLLGAETADGPRPLLDWKSNAIDAPIVDHYLHFDGPSGFQRVLAAQAAPAGDDPSLRIFGGTPYGALVGTAPPALPETNDPAATARVDALFKNLGVVPLAPKSPWLDVHATIDLPPGRPVALAMNGTIGAISETYRAPGSDTAEFWAVLPAHLFRPGGNGLSLWAIDGSSRNPTLRPIAIAGSSNPVPTGSTGDR